MQREGIIIQIREDGTRVVTRNLGDMADKSMMADKALKLVKGTLVGLTASITVDRVAAYADAWASAAGMVSVFTKSAQEQIVVQNQLFNVSQKNRMGMEESVKLYSRMAMAQENLGASSAEIARAVDAVGMSLVIQHTSASQVQGGLLQLGQAFGGARIQAQEFNSLIDQMPMLLVGIAKHIEGTDGTLNGLSRKVKDSTVTNKEFFDALMKSYPDMEANFQKAAFTIAQGFTVMNNATMKWVGENEKVMQMQRMWGEMSRWYAANVNTILDATANLIGVMVSLGAAYLAVQVAMKGNAILAAAGHWVTYQAAAAKGNATILGSTNAVRAQHAAHVQAAQGAAMYADAEAKIATAKVASLTATRSLMVTEQAKIAADMKASAVAVERAKSVQIYDQQALATQQRLTAAETAYNAVIKQSANVQQALVATNQQLAAAKRSSNSVDVQRLTLLKATLEAERAAIPAQLAAAQGKLDIARKTLISDQQLAANKQILIQAETQHNAVLARAVEHSKALKVATDQLTVAEKAEAAATREQAVANATLNTATDNAAKATSMMTRAVAGLNTALNMLGGPLGLIMLAAMAWMTYKTNAAMAREESIRVGDAIDTTRAALDKLTTSQKQVTHAQLVESIRAQRKELDLLVNGNTMLMGAVRATNGTATEMIAYFRNQAAAVGLSNKAIDKGIVTIGEYDKARLKLLQTERQAEEVTLSQLNLLPKNYVLMDQGSQKLGTMESQARAVASAFGNLAEKMADVGRASGQLVMPQFSADMDKLLKKQEDQIKLLNIKDPTARAGESAVLDAIASGTLKEGDTAGTEIIRRNAMMIQSLQASEKAMKGAGKEAESLERQLRKVVSEFDPADGAALKYKHSVDILTKALAAGKINQDQFNKYTTLAKDHFTDLADPMRQVNRELEQQNKLLQMGSREREIEAQVMQITNDMRDKARFLTKAETEALREKLTVQQQLQEMSAAKDSLTGGSMAEQARQFSTQLEAIKSMVGTGGFGQSDAILGLAGGGMFAGMFEGTDELLTAQVEKFNWMYEQIGQLRQTNLIGDETAAMMRARIETQMLEMQLQSHQSFYGDLGSLANSENRKLAMIGKAAAITKATMDGYLIVQRTWAETGNPFLAAAAGVKAAVNVAAIAGLGFETGGSFVVGGQGGADSQMVSFRATPGEKVTVATPNQVRKGDETSNGGSGSQNSDNMSPQIINVLDPNMLDVYLNSPRGRKTLINWIGEDASQISGLLKEG